MGIVTKIRQRRAADRFAAIPWLPRECGGVGAGMALDHVQALRAIADRVPADDGHCQKLFIASLPCLTVWDDSIFARFGSPNPDIPRLLDEIVTQRARTIQPAIVAAAPSFMPAGFPVDTAAVLRRIRSALIAGEDVDGCDRVVRADMCADPIPYCGEPARWLDENFERTYALLEAGIDWTKYPGLKLDPDRCRREFREGWDWQRDATAESRRLLAALDESPADFIHDFDSWLDAILRHFCAEIGAQLSAQLPAGCSLHPDNCFATAKKIIDRATFQKLPEAFGELVAAFMEAFNGDTCHYVTGLQEIYETQAKVVLDTLLPSMRSQLPIGGTVNKQVCIRALVNLMKSNTKPEELVKRFAEKIVASPGTYFDIPRPTIQQSSGCSDQAMMSSSRPRRY